MSANVCPECGSDDLEPEVDEDDFDEPTGYYECLKCGRVSHESELVISEVSP